MIRFNQKLKIEKIQIVVIFKYHQQREWLKRKTVQMGHFIFPFVLMCRLKLRIPYQVTVESLLY